MESVVSVSESQLPVNALKA